MPFPDRPGNRPDPSRAVAQYRRRAGRYDLELAPFEPVRRSAIELLDVQPGDTVLDVGCGTGLSFAGLLAKAGPRGRVIGIDPSPEMLALARERCLRHGWRNVELLEATAAGAAFHGRANAALFHFTHDVLRDPDALDHVFGHLAPGAHVVASGLQWAPPWMIPTNLFVWGAALYSVTCMDGLEQPWSMLARRLASFGVRTFPWFGIYIAQGRVPARH
jgi:demethylmenaquinone methyltransferase/2-methoxy-6-polyprenyl-1,4-benzoquinol methylase